MFFKTTFYLNINKWLLLTMILCMFSYGDISHAGSLRAKEYQVKAVFLYNFANFIRWPQTVFTNQHAPFNICLVGHDPFRQSIDTIIKNEQINKRSVKIKRLKNMRNVGICQILYVSQSEAANLTVILNFVRKFPILTVSDINNFVIKGGMIQFFKHRKRIRFSIAPNTLKNKACKLVPIYFVLLKLYLKLLL